MVRGTQAGIETYRYGELCDRLTGSRVVEFGNAPCERREHPPGRYKKTNCKSPGTNSDGLKCPPPDQPVRHGVHAESQKCYPGHHGVRKDYQPDKDHEAQKIAFSAVVLHQVYQEIECGWQKGGRNDPWEVALCKCHPEVVREHHEKNTGHGRPSQADPWCEQEHGNPAQKRGDEQQIVAGHEYVAGQFVQPNQREISDWREVTEHLLPAVPLGEQVGVPVPLPDLLAQVNGLDQVPPGVGRPGIDGVEVARKNDA